MSRLPRLLAGARPTPMALDEHLARHDEPRLRGERLIDAVQQAGLLGRGGAAFPTGVKLRAVAGARGTPVVVVNATEGEPLSAKDETLARTLPHLILDGAVLAAEAVGAPDVVVAVCDHMPAAHDALAGALAERDGAIRPELTSVPSRFIAGQESALVSYLDGGELRPAFTPPRVFERGLARRPTLVSNAETLAQLALIARHGPAWFRELGLPGEPGSMLVTLAGCVGAPGVYEVARGMELAALLDVAGGATEPFQAVLVGGYFGTWLGPEEALRAALSGASLSAQGAAIGAGVIFALSERACAASELAGVAAYLAEHSARQCGPCTHGLDAIAATLAEVREGRPRPRAEEHLARWMRIVPGRGACHHPDGAVRFLGSGLRVFAGVLADHARHGPCEACAAPGRLPTPAPDAVSVR